MKAPVQALTVVVSTRNRPVEILRAVQSIQENNYPEFRTIIVDQSDNDRTIASLNPILSKPEFKYIRTNAKGLSIGRNLGIAAAQSELIAITDDDCEVPSDWLQKLAIAFGVDRRIGIVFGNVNPAEHNKAQGFIPSYIRKESYCARRLREKSQIEGVGACMGLRRSIWQQLNGFDEMFGAGAPLKSASENDLVMRSLLAGYLVYETPDFSVIHHGFRSWSVGLRLIQGYLYGIGASLAKQIKCGHYSVLYILISLAERWFYKSPVVDLGNRYQRSLRLRAFIKGFCVGLLLPLDRTSGHYKKRENNAYSI